MAESEDFRLSSKTVCVYDNGLHTSLAQSLVGQFGQVFYFSPWVQGFPRSNATIIGTGIPGVQRLLSIWPLIDEIDLFIFPDIYHAPEQKILRERFGKRVWGSGLVERLEYERRESKDWIRKLGLAVGRYKAVIGMDDLRSHLQSNDDQYVKISRTRGDMETFHAKTYDLIEPRLSELEHTLGAKKTIMEFVCEGKIEAKAEVGYDGFTVDGNFPSQALFGVETKDAGYVGQVVPYSGLPRSIGYVNSRLSPIFRSLHYRGFFSSEIRVANDGTPYLIDPCCRMASPPGELYQHLIANLGEVIFEGAAGKLVEPIWRHEWGAELILTSDWAEHGWQPIEFPDEISGQVKLHYHTVIDGKNYYVPQAVTMPEIGAVVAGGPTKEAAIKAVTEIAEQVRGYDVKFNAAALEEAAAGMDELRKAA